MSQKTSFILLGAWFSFALALLVSHEGMNGDSITRLLILGYFVLSLLWYFTKGRSLQIKNPKKTFILWCTANAMVVEVFYMISRPLSNSLLITLQTPFAEMVQHVTIDLVLTTPVYLLIFWIMWKLMNRYTYTVFSFFFLMGLGQALGDSWSFFLPNPVMFIFIPYIMLNYWTMNFVPFLLVRSSISAGSVKENKFEKVIYPLILLPLTYLIAGGTVLFIGSRVLGWIPK